MTSTGIAAATLAGTLGVLAGGLTLWLYFAHRRYTRFLRQHSLPLPRLTAGAAARYYLGVVASLLKALWWQLRARGHHDLRPSEGPVSGPPVLCVHGFFMNPTCFWGLRRALERRGRATEAVFLGWPHRPLAAYAPPLVAALSRLTGPGSAGRVDVVAHSMGGLVLRLVAARHPELASRLRRVVTLGSPHRGTPVSRSLPVGPEVREMGLGSALLDALPHLVDTAPRAEVTTVAADPDLVVYPLDSAHLPGARQLTLPGLSHLGLVTDRRAIRVVVGLLCDEPRQTTAGPAAHS